MNITNEVIDRLTKKIYQAKLRLLSYHGFFGSLLIGMNFVLVTDNKTIKNKTGAATDGKTIYFMPEQLDSYSNQELDIVIMHELMHIALKHVYRGKGHDKKMYNRACDIVVNSNIKHCLGLDDDQPLLVQGIPLESNTPTGKEGKLYSAEEVYDMLLDAELLSDKPSNGKSKDDQNKQNSYSNDNSEDSDDSNDDFKDGKESKSKNKKSSKTSTKSKSKQDEDDSSDDSGNHSDIDDHSIWDDVNELDDYEEDLLDEKILKAKSIADAKDQLNKGCGTVPLGVERQIKDLQEPQIDWKEYLQSFIQEEITDYSFSPPDRRFQDSPFILPDLNESEVSVKNILFMVDTSGSMSEREITDCYSEINGAIQQYNGKLQGYIGFFDAEVAKVQEFDFDTDITKIVPLGGGGTDFTKIFKYVEENMSDNLPSSVVILTDGYCDFPKEKDTLGLPILWVINNKVINPPYGKVARINIKKI